MLRKCRATGKISFASYVEARLCMLAFRWYRYHKKDMFGKRIKHRQGKAAQKRVYYCPHCIGFHLTKQSKNTYLKNPDRTILKLVLV